MSNLLMNSPPLCALASKLLHRNSSPPLLSKGRLSRRVPVARACLFKPPEDPILKEALKEPVAFMSGIFAGLLRLDLKEEPLREWVNRTVQASGITEEDIDSQEQKSEEEAPQQIDIE